MSWYVPYVHHRHYPRYAIYAHPRDEIHAKKLLRWLAEVTAAEKKEKSAHSETERINREKMKMKVMEIWIPNLTQRQLQLQRWEQRDQERERMMGRKTGGYNTRSWRGRR